MLHKQRKSGTETEVTNVIGEVSNRPCLIVDDIISTGGTLAESVKALLEAGARPDIIISVTHGLLIQGARNRLDDPAIREVLVTDTVPVTE